MEKNNIEMFNLLVEYSIEKGKKLIIDENDIENAISEKYSFCKLKDISEINFIFVKLTYLWKNKNLIEVMFSENSYFLKRFNEFNENKRIENESKNYEVLEIENEITKIKLENQRKAKKKINNEYELKKIELKEEKRKKKK